MLEDPFEDPEGLVFPSRSPSPTMENFKSSRIAIDEEIDEFAGKKEGDVIEEIQVKEAKAHAHILTMVRGGEKM